LKKPTIRSRGGKLKVLFLQRKSFSGGGGKKSGRAASQSRCSYAISVEEETHWRRGPGEGEYDKGPPGAGQEEIKTRELDNGKNLEEHGRLRDGIFRGKSMTGGSDVNPGRKG